MAYGLKACSCHPLIGNYLFPLYIYVSCLHMSIAKSRVLFAFAFTIQHIEYQNIKYLYTCLFCFFQYCIRIGDSYYLCTIFSLFMQVRTGFKTDNKCDAIWGNPPRENLKF